MVKDVTLFANNAPGGVVSPYCDLAKLLNFEDPQIELPRPTINGFPCFDQVHCFNKEKEDKLREILVFLDSKDQENLDKITLMEGEKND